MSGSVGMDEFLNVDGGLAMDCSEGKTEDFEMDSVVYREPMQGC